MRGSAGLFFVPALQQAQASEVRAHARDAVRRPPFSAGFSSTMRPRRRASPVDSLDSPLPFTIGHTRGGSSKRAARSLTPVGWRARPCEPAARGELGSHTRLRAIRRRDAVTAGGLIAASTGRARGAAEFNVARSSAVDRRRRVNRSDGSLSTRRAAVGLRVAAMRSVPEVDGSWIDHAHWFLSGGAAATRR
jgi:hypothetical protein